MGAASRRLKISVIILNAILVVAGIIYLAVGIQIVLKIRKHPDWKGRGHPHTVRSAACWLAVSGVLHIITPIFGCVGAILKKPMLIVLYAMFLLLSVMCLSMIQFVTFVSEYKDSLRNEDVHYTIETETVPFRESIEQYATDSEVTIKILIYVFIPIELLNVVTNLWLVLALRSDEKEQHLASIRAYLGRNENSPNL